MIRKSIFAALIIVLAAGGYYLYFVYLDQLARSSRAALPAQSSLIVEYESWDKVRDYYKRSYFAKNKDTLPFIGEVMKRGRFYKEWLGESVLKKSFLEQPTFIALNYAVADTGALLFIIKQKKDLMELLGYDRLSRYMGELRSKGTYNITKQTGNAYNTPIYRISKKEGKGGLSCAYTNSLLLMSSHTDLLKRSLKRLKEDPVLAEEQPSFKKVYDLKESNTHLNLYVNYSYLPPWLQRVLKEEQEDTLGFLKDMAAWTTIDCILNDKNLLFSGYTVTHDTIPQFLDLYRHQQPQSLEMLNILPPQTGCLLWSGFSNYERWYKKYRRNFSAPQSAYFDQYIKPWIGSEVGWASIKYQSTQHNIAVLRHEQKAQVKETLKPVSSDTVSMVKGKVIQKINITDTTPASPRILSPLWGKIFHNFVNPAYVVLGDYVVFANQPLTLELLVQDYVHQQVIGKDLNYMPLRDNLSSTAHFTLYFNINNGASLIDSRLRPALPLAPYDAPFDHYNKAAFQFTATGDYLYTNGCILPAQQQMPDTLQKEELEPNKITLDTALAMAPQYVLNHDNRTLEIMVQDKDRQLYLISPRGEILWKKQLKGFIQSPVRQMDYYDNGKLQYVFNTTGRIYIIDRLGNNVENFPVALETGASNGMQLVQYNNEKYRYFVGGVNNALYGYYKEGEGLPGWSPLNIKGTPRQPLQHFYRKGKDYLVVTTDKGYFYGFNRRGEERIPTTKLDTPLHHPVYKDTETSPLSFVMSGKQGRIYHVNIEGEVEQQTIEQFSHQHYFAYRDITGDASSEYIFIDKKQLRVYNQEQQLVFSYVFESPIKTPPFFLKVPGQTDDNYRIGVVDEVNRKIYLFNEDGSPYAHFPLQGGTRFDVEDIYNSGTPYCLTGTTDSSIFLYKLPAGES